ncbi:MAG: transporter-related protein [Candidatus Saccharibacteria bacterium]|nr:transporter-related protein [Candidatus Saccharibacteria bacterium]
MKELFRVFGYTKNLRHLLIIVTVVSIFGALLTFGISFTIKNATDAIVAIVGGNGASPTSVVWFAIVLLGIGVGNRIIDDVGGYYGDILAVRMRQQLSNGYYKHLLTLPQGYFDDEVTGKIINRLNRAISDITNFINFLANNLLQMLLSIVIAVGVMLYYSWPLAILILLLIPTFLWITAKTSVKWQAFEKEKNTHFDIASGRFAEVIGQVRLVKSFNSQKREQEAFATRFYSMVGITHKQSFLWHKMNFVRGLVLSVIFGLIYGILFYQTAAGHLTIGEMVLLSTLATQVSFPLERMSFFIDMYQRAVANSRDYDAAMKEKSEVIDESGKKEINANHAKIEFKNVEFAYGTNKKVLHGISFTIEPGNKLALVGESGGGKSTIANLLMRLYSPNEGSVVINGMDIHDATQQSLRDAVATVFQDASLFSGTIRENIAYAKPDATDSEIIAAAKAANAYDFVKELKDELDTEIGERGIKLSGGQKQRIAIARALLKDAPILILDEATSSLDSRSEVIVQDALDRLMQDRTVLIIAHRLSTIASVDTILTLKHGRVDEVGTPAELAKTNGIYAQLLELQTATTEKAREKLQRFDMAA